MVGDLFFFTWKAKNQPILSINAVSPKIAKRRILAALWRSPVLSILQTENLKRKASHFDWRRLSKNVPIGTLHIRSEADDASYCGTIVKQCFIWKGGFMKHILCLRALLVKHQNIWSGTACHEAHLRCMKRSLFRLHFFLPSENKTKKWWPDPESNWGHGDFQSPALPTELSCHLQEVFLLMPLNISSF